MVGGLVILALAVVLGMWAFVRGCDRQGGTHGPEGRSSKNGGAVLGGPGRLLVIRGTLHDEAGTPVAGAAVLVTRYGLGLALPDASTVTDAQGGFEVVSAGVGIVDVEVIGPHCARILRRFETGSGGPDRWGTGKKGGRGAGGMSPGSLDRTGGKSAAGAGGRAVRRAVHVLDVGTLICLPGGSLVGTVVDEKGKALSGALVTARKITPLGLSGQAFSGLSGQNGGFAIDHLSLGRYEVTVRAAGYSPQVFESVEVPGRMGLVSLSPLVELGGRVTSEGRPVPGAHVRLAGSGLWPGLVTDTDQDGRFRFQNLGQGIYEIEAWKGNSRSKPLVGLMVGLGSGSCPLQFLGRDTRAKGCPELTLALEPGVDVVGKVVEAGTNRPLSGARIVLGQDLLTSLAFRAESDDKGTFRIDALLPGKYYLAVDRDGYLSWSAVQVRVSRSAGLRSPDMSDLQTGFSLSPNGRAISILRIVMDRGAGIVGQVVDDVGNPVAGAKLSIVYAGRGLWAGTWSGRRERIRRGLFERALAVRNQGLGGNESLGVVPGPVPALPTRAPSSVAAGSGLGTGSGPGPGRAGISAGRLGLVDADRPGGGDVDGGPSALSRGTGTRGQSAVLDGAVGGTRSDAAPADGGIVDAGLVPATRPDRFVTDEEGRFRIQGLAPGRVVILVTHPSYAQARSRRLRLRMGKILGGLRIVMRPGLDLEGRVDDEQGAPQRGVFVTATDRLGLVVGRLARTDRNGHFVLKNLAGRVHLRFERPGYLSLVLDMDLRGADRSRRIRVTIKRADRTFEGWVTDPDDHPVAGLLVEAVSLEPSSPGRSAAVTDGKGAFKVVGLGAVPYLIRLSHPDYPRTEFAHLDLSRKAHLRLRYGGGIEGIVRDRATRALVRNVTARLVGPSGPALTRTFPDGRIVWKALQAGRYRLTLSADGYAPITVSLRIAEGTAPGQVTLRGRQWWLDLSGSLEGLVRDDRGFPLFLADVWCERKGKRLGGGVGGSGGDGVVQTDRKGRFSLVGLPAGPCLLRARHPDFGTGRLQVDVRAGEPPRSVIVDLNGKPEGEARETVTSGVAISLAARGDDVVIAKVTPGSKAQAAGLRRGDLLRSIDGEAVEGEGLSDLGRRLEGPVGSRVVIVVERSGRALTVPVEREMLPGSR